MRIKIKYEWVPGWFSIHIHFLRFEYPDSESHQWMCCVLNIQLLQSLNCCMDSTQIDDEVKSFAISLWEIRGSSKSRSSSHRDVFGLKDFLATSFCSRSLHSEFDFYSRMQRSCPVCRVSSDAASFEFPNGHHINNYFSLAAGSSLSFADATSSLAVESSNMNYRIFYEMHVPLVCQQKLTSEVCFHNENSKPPHLSDRNKLL